MNTAKMLRHVNVRNCLRLLRDTGPMSRADLARALGTTRTTVGYAIAELEAEGLVTTTGNAGGDSKGRPGLPVSLNPAGAHFHGVEVEGDHFTVALVDFTLTKLASLRADFDLATNTPEDLCQAITQKTEELLPAAAPGRLFGLGISMPGIITPTGRVTIPGSRRWSDVPFQSMLEDAAPDGRIIRCSNDAVAFAMGHSGQLSAPDKDNMFFVLLTPAGIGSVHMRNGVVDRGVQGIAGEIGLIQMAPGSGRPGRNFQQMAQSLLPPEIANRAKAGLLDEVDTAALAPWAEVIARGLLDAIYLLDPARIAVMGALAPVFSQVGDQIQGHLRDWMMPGLQVPEIRVLSSGPETALMGAAALVREQLFALPQIGETGRATG
ncbi:ROK family protein [Paracoccus sp. (in: a-proteobacteria)]|uniref:ROK family protein n=1 Tax=Paracoccus sp. TaxID=267 RepID=UPI003A88955A